MTNHMGCKSASGIFSNERYVSSGNICDIPKTDSSYTGKGMEHQYPDGCLAQWQPIRYEFRGSLAAYLVFVIFSDKCDSFDYTVSFISGKQSGNGNVHKPWNIVFIAA